MITTPVKLWRRQEKVGGIIGKTGKILHWTIIRVPAKAFSKEAPYPVVIVELESKKRMIGQLVDWEEKDLKKGKSVVAVIRKSYPVDRESIISYHIKFKP